MRRYRRVGWFSLIVLAMGLLSMDLDILINHSNADALPCKYCNAIGTHRAVHVARNEQLTKEDQPCNACFFRNILGQVLLPVGHNLNAVIRGILYSDIYRTSFVYCSFDINVNRGPPSKPAHLIPFLVAFFLG